MIELTLIHSLELGKLYSPNKLKILFYFEVNIHLNKIKSLVNEIDYFSVTSYFYGLWNPGVQCHIYLQGLSNSPYIEPNSSIRLIEIHCNIILAHSHRSF